MKCAFVTLVSTVTCMGYFIPQSLCFSGFFYVSLQIGTVILVTFPPVFLLEGKLTSPVVGIVRWLIAVGTHFSALQTKCIKCHTLWFPPTLVS